MGYYEAGIVLVGNNDFVVAVDDNRHNVSSITALLLCYKSYAIVVLLAEPVYNVRV